MWCEDDCCLGYSFREYPYLLQRWDNPPRVSKSLLVETGEVHLSCVEWSEYIDEYGREWPYVQTFSITLGHRRYKKPYYMAFYRIRGKGKRVKFCRTTDEQKPFWREWTRNICDCTRVEDISVRHEELDWCIVSETDTHSE